MELKNKAPKIKIVYLENGIHSLGNSLSIVSKEGDTSLELFEAGVLATSISRRRKVFVPFNNIRGMEMDFDYQVKLSHGQDEELKPELKAVANKK